MHAYGGGVRLEGRPAVKRPRGRPTATASASSLSEMADKKKVGATKVHIFPSGHATYNLLSHSSRSILKTS